MRACVRYYRSCVGYYSVLCEILERLVLDIIALACIIVFVLEYL